jgi:chromosome segregation ATPase
MVKVEVGRDGRMNVVHSSKKKGSSKQQTETVYVVDEAAEQQLYSEIDKLRALVTHLRESNKNLTKVAQESQVDAKDWKADAQFWKDEHAKVEAGRGLLEDKVDRRNKELREKSKEIDKLTEDKKKAEKLIDDYKTESIRRGSIITELKDDNRRLKDDKTKMEASLRDEIKDLTRALLSAGRDDRDHRPRRRPASPLPRPYDTDYWDRVGQLPLRDPPRNSWGRNYESDR